MNDQKSLLTRLGEAIDQHRAVQREIMVDSKPAKQRGWLHWLGRLMIPNIGTLVLVVVLILIVPSLAAPNQSPAATSISTIPYQGRLADSGGTPVTAMQNMEFRIYDVPTGGTPLWEELWTGGNAVSVSDGLFSVLLGSLNMGLTAVVQGHDELYLGVTVGTDSEMSPRVQLGSVPFSMQALTVPDGSISTDKLADGAVTEEKLSSDINLKPPADSITTTMLSDGAVTMPKLAEGVLTTENLMASYDGYYTWLGTQQQFTGPGWTAITDASYRNLTIVVDSDALLDISWLVSLSGQGTGRAAVKLLVDGADIHYAYTKSDKSMSISNRILLPVGSGSHTLELQIGSWDTQQVTLAAGPLSFSVVAFDR